MRSKQSTFLGVVKPTFQGYLSWFTHGPFDKPFATVSMVENDIKCSADCINKLRTGRQFSNSLN